MPAASRGITRVTYGVDPPPIVAIFFVVQVGCGVERDFVVPTIQKYNTHTVVIVVTEPQTKGKSSYLI